MRILALGFLIGVCIAQQLSQLWSWPGLLLGLLALPWCFSANMVWRFLASLVCGLVWTQIHAHWVLSDGLKAELLQQVVVVEGDIASLPRQDEHSLRFEFDVDELYWQGQAQDHPKRIKMAWYGRFPAVNVGEHWRLHVRLKPPRGFRNGYGFDYETWLYQKHIRASAYVVAHQQNQKLADNAAISINRLRQAIREQINLSLPQQHLSGLIAALAVGDRDGISQQQWSVFTKTGTNHLMAISGLHIGLVAAMSFFMFRWLWCRSRRAMLFLAADKAALGVAICMALLYAALAGFAIPTQRALIMTAVVMWGITNRRLYSSVQILSMAMLLVLIVDANAVLSAGFWLSFCAVAAILFSFHQRIGKQPWWWLWLRLQFIVSLALVPVLFIVFQQASLISPLANLIAVPWVSVLVVPLVLLGGVLCLFTPEVATLLWTLAHFFMDELWLLLKFFAKLEWSVWQTPQVTLWVIISSCIAIAFLFLPKGTPTRYWGLVCLLPLVFYKPATPAPGEALIRLLDVGQGLSLLIQTQHHALLYDTGARFSEQFDAGQAVVLPVLRALGIKQLDTLLISHDDNDHVGGLASLRENLGIKTLMVTANSRYASQAQQICQAGHSWSWDGIQFQILHPGTDRRFKIRNDSSCVLKISSPGASILLTGDIEKSTEQHLLSAYKVLLSSDVLQIPHHGSNTSSSLEFLQAVRPKLAIGGIGYANRFGFPKAEVLQRYEDQGIKVYHSGEDGMITLRLTNTDISSVQTFNRSALRYWHSR